MRIIAGKLKGSILNIPKDNDTRPLKDLVRESIFNLLVHSNKISLQLKKSNILDLYAGTGSFGLECLSREAKTVYFVENGKNAIHILEKNITKLNVNQKIKIFIKDVLKFINKESVFQIKFDLIFCDPPFNDKYIEKLIDAIFNKNLLNEMEL